MSIVERYFLEFDGFQQRLSHLLIADQGITLLFGASGSGKSCFLRSLMGLEPRADLKWLWQEKDGSWVDLGRLRPAQRRLGVVFQDSWVFPHLRVEEILNLAYKASALDASEFNQELQSVTSDLEIGPLMRRKGLQLSGGERQRVAFALALLARPRLLLLDEPFASLDERIRESARDLLKQIVQKRKIGALLVSHDGRDRIPWADHEILFPLPS